jgi:hypothetical protein
MVLTSAAGYIGPGLVGLGAAALLAHGHAVGLLWLALLLLALMLVQIRNWFGLWLILVAGLAVFAVSWWGSVNAQTAFAFTLTWFLLLGAPRAVLELPGSRRQGRGDSDADVLGRLTRLPGAVWVAVFFVVTVATLVVGGRWLVATAS